MRIEGCKRTVTIVLSWSPLTCLLDSQNDTGVGGRWGVEYYSYCAGCGAVLAN